MAGRMPCAPSAARPAPLSMERAAERTIAPRRTTGPAAGGPPRSRALRSASQRRARPLSADNSADVTDRYDDEQGEEEDEADRMDRGLELRRESLAEDAGDQDEEEATAIEAR